MARPARGPAMRWKTEVTRWSVRQSAQSASQIPQPVQLQMWTFIFSQFQRLEVQDQSALGVGY